MALLNIAVFLLCFDKSFAKWYNTHNTHKTPPHRDTYTMGAVQQDTAAQFAEVKAKCGKPV